MEPNGNNVFNIENSAHPKVDFLGGRQEWSYRQYRQKRPRQVAYREHERQLLGGQYSAYDHAWLQFGTEIGKVFQGEKGRQNIRPGHGHFYHLLAPIFRQQCHHRILFGFFRALSGDRHASFYLVGLDEFGDESLHLRLLFQRFQQVSPL